MTTQMSKMKEELRGTIKGSVLVPDDPGYDDARQIWNAMPPEQTTQKVCDRVLEFCRKHF